MIQETWDVIDVLGSGHQMEIPSLSVLSQPVIAGHAGIDTANDLLAGKCGHWNLGRTLSKEVCW